MAIQFVCPKCAQKATLTSSRPGDWIECPGCDATVQIPGPAAAPPKPRPTPAPATRTPAAAPAAPESEDEPRGVWADKRVRVGAVAGGMCLLAVGALVVLLALQKPKPAPEVVQAETPPPAPPKTAPPVAQPKPKPEPPPAPKPETSAPVAPPVAPQPIASQPVDPPRPVAQQTGRLEQAPPPRVKPPRPPSRVVMVPVAVAKAEARRLKLGVNPAGSDDVGAVLRDLGDGYGYADLTEVDLESGDRLKKYDVVFLNCGGEVTTNTARATRAVRDFVAMGGTLYASDHQYPFVAACFPNAGAAPKSFTRADGDYKAEVLDEGLQKQLGKTVDLTFNAGQWQAATFNGKAVSVVLRATGNGGLKKGTPLLVKFPHGKGTVIYTSFHNSGVGGDTAKTLLRYLVFSAVIADAEARIKEVLERDKFAVKSSEILTAAAAGWSATKSYTLDKEGRFRVAVGFHNDSAEVQLTATSPEGDDVTFTHEGKDAFMVDLTNAPAGEWKLKVTAKKVPNPNFPVTLVVAEPK